LIKKGGITLGEINEVVGGRHIMTAGSPSGTTINQDSILVEEDSDL